MQEGAPASGMRTFFVIWVGQFGSAIGTGLTQFGLGVWVYQSTGSVSLYGLILLVLVLPRLIAAPVAGILVDRWDRRWAMILSDAGSAVFTLVIATLLVTDRLEIWHLFPLLAFGALFQSIQMPAYTAATTLLVPKRNLGRASGLVQTGQSLALLVAPISAGFLLNSIQIQGIVLIDFATFLIAVLTLLIVRVPRPEPSTAGTGAGGSFRQQIGLGFTFLKTRSGLIALMVFFAIVNFSLGVIQVLITPMVLEFSSPQVLGTILSVGSVGMLIGAVALGVLGVPARRVVGLLGFGLFLGLGMMGMGLRPSAPVITVAFFVTFLSVPFINGCSQVIWQVKTPPDIQGRVFAVRQMVSWSSLPLGYLLAASLADRVFEPLLLAEGPLAGSVGSVLGVGAGRGSGLLILLMGLLAILTCFAGYLYPRLRRLEEELPDVIADEPPQGEEPQLESA